MIDWSHDRSYNRPVHRFSKSTLDREDEDPPSSTFAKTFLFFSLEIVRSVTIRTKRHSRSEPLVVLIEGSSRLLNVLTKKRTFSLTVRVTFDWRQCLTPSEPQFIKSIFAFFVCTSQFYHTETRGLFNRTVESMSSNTRTTLFDLHCCLLNFIFSIETILRSIVDSSDRQTSIPFSTSIGRFVSMMTPNTSWNNLRIREDLRRRCTTKVFFTHSTHIQVDVKWEDLLSDTDQLVSTSNCSTDQKRVWQGFHPIPCSIVKREEKWSNDRLPWISNQLQRAIASKLLGTFRTNVTRTTFLCTLW